MADRDARDKLRSMGGIMASSPELMRAVEERLNVIPPAREQGFIPPNAPYFSRTAATGQMPPEDLFRLQRRVDRMNAPASPENKARDLATMAENMGLTGLSVGGSQYIEDARAAGMPYTPTLPSSDPLENLLKGTLVSRTAGDPVGDQLPTALFRDESVTAQFPGAGAPRGVPAPSEMLPGALGSGSVPVREYLTVPTIGDAVPGSSGEKRPEEQSAEPPAPKEPTPEEPTPEELAPKELVRRIVDATERQINDPEPKAKKDLRSRYSENLALFKEIYGIDEEDRARDKMMSLAMIGLAIAAGQSPNALTNIAQGALSGLKGMSESEAERRQQDRDLRTAALEAALSGEAAATEAEAELAKMEYDRETELEVQRLKNLGSADAPEGEKQRQEYLYNDVFRTTLSAELENSPGNVQAALQKARLAAVTAAPGAPSAQAGGAVSPVVGTPDAGVEETIAAQRAAGSTDDQIRKMLEEAGKNGEAKFTPALYGL